MRRGQLTATKKIYKAKSHSSLKTVASGKMQVIFYNTAHGVCEAPGINKPVQF